MTTPVQDTQPRPTPGRIPRPWRLTYLGPQGTFTERALRTLPEADGSRLLPAATAARALELVHRGDADAAMLPVHNTVAGPVGDSVRALAESPAPGVLREVVLPVEFALLVRPGTPLAAIRTVSGHPHAGAQVGGWLAGRLPRARWLPAPSNAEAARRVRDGACDAAVAGDFTAAHYGLGVLVAGIQDTAGAATRFLLCARSGARVVPPVRQADRTSLVGRIAGPPDGLGALLDDLRRHPFLRAVSLHTVPDGRGGSVLFADCPGSAEQPETARAVGLLRLRLPALRSLGSYASAPCAPPPYERRLKTMHSETTTAGEAAPRDIARLRERIDDLDRSLIGTLKQRLETSREIQRIRTGGGGAPLDSGRELSVRGRYAEELGEGGAGLAEALLEMCRGRSPR
ncbi:chorismate mutase [Streptomyces sp. AC512_CC834]|uniref:chorismate mutase n=1 Tax=Streptomyces sp. AC512_CC834 TaxID=2823691 RepID=UPI001C26F442|nr:chorismate mutase [Streptomyces sp. AC512_CC834]